MFRVLLILASAIGWGLGEGRGRGWWRECESNPYPLTFSRYYDYTSGHLRDFRPEWDSCPYRCHNKTRFLHARCNWAQYYYSLLRLRTVCEQSKFTDRLPRGKPSCVDRNDLDNRFSYGHSAITPDMYSNRNWTVFVGKFTTYEGNSFEAYADKWTANLKKMNRIQETGITGYDVKMEGDPGLRMIIDNSTQFSYACASLVVGISGVNMKGYGPDRKENSEPLRYVFDLNLPQNESECNPCAEDGVSVEEICMDDESFRCTSSGKFMKICLTFVYTVPVMRVGSQSECEPSDLLQDGDTCQMNENLTELVRTMIKSRVRTNECPAISNLDKPPQPAGEPVDPVRLQEDNRCYSIVYYYGVIATHLSCTSQKSLSPQEVYHPDFSCLKPDILRLCGDAATAGYSYYMCDWVVKTGLGMDYRAGDAQISIQGEVMPKPYMWAMKSNKDPSPFHYMFNRWRQFSSGKQVFLKVVGGTGDQHNCGVLWSQYFENDNLRNSYKESNLKSIKQLSLFNFDLPSKRGMKTGVVRFKDFTEKVGRTGVLGEQGDIYLTVRTLYVILEVEEQKGFRFCRDSDIYNCTSGVVNEIELKKVLSHHTRVERKKLKLHTPRRFKVALGDHKARRPHTKYNRKP